MPSVTIPGGIVYYFTDSGAPAQGQYSTLVFFHGMGFTGAVFQRLFPVALNDGMRVIAVNRRDYPGSTGFSEDELQRMSGTPEEQDQFLHDEGVNTAHLLVTLIKQCQLHDIVPVGWSLGAQWVFSMLANLKDIPNGVLDSLEQHVKTVIAHDASTTGLGIANPPEYNIDLWYTPDPEVRHQLFLEWCAAYYKHEDIDSHDTSKISFNEPAPKPMTFHDLSKDEILPMTAWRPFVGSDLAVVLIDLEVGKNIARRAFFDPELSAQFLPGLKARFLYGRESTGPAIVAAWKLEDSLKDQTFFGGLASRDLKVLQTTKGNHLFFWDYPQTALAEYRKCMA